MSITSSQMQTVHWYKKSSQRTDSLSSKHTCLACMTLCWHTRTRVSHQASPQHALHSVATWHDTPTATVCSLSISVWQVSGLSKHTKKLDSIHDMFCFFTVSIWKWVGWEGRGLRRTPPFPYREERQMASAWDTYSLEESGETWHC